MREKEEEACVNMCVCVCVFKAENEHTVTSLSGMMASPELNVQQCSLALEPFSELRLPPSLFCFSSVFCLNLSHKLLKLAGSG